MLLFLRTIIPLGVNPRKYSTLSSPCKIKRNRYALRNINQSAAFNYLCKVIAYEFLIFQSVINNTAVIYWRRHCSIFEIKLDSLFVIYERTPDRIKSSFYVIFREIGLKNSRGESFEGPDKAVGAGRKRCRRLSRPSECKISQIN